MQLHFVSIVFAGASRLIGERLRAEDLLAAAKIIDEHRPFNVDDAIFQYEHSSRLYQCCVVRHTTSDRTVNAAQC
jgi:hypothetical protein